MRIIIAGSRTIVDIAAIEYAVKQSGFDVTEVVSGGAVGADKLGEMYARRRGLPVTVFEAEWEHHGKRAGLIRNCEMAAYAHGLVVVWDGQSRGTRHMIEEAKRRSLPMYVHKVVE